MSVRLTFWLIVASVVGVWVALIVAITSQHQSVLYLIVPLLVVVLWAAYSLYIHYRLNAGYRDLSRVAFDTMLDGLVVISERGIIENVNKATLSGFGYKREELIGQNVSCLMPQNHAEQHDAYMHNYHVSGIAKVMGLRRQLEAQRKDGTRFPIELQVSEGWHGSRRFYTGIIYDITQQVESDKKLKAQQDLFEISVQSAGVGFAIVSREGRFLVHNKALGRWFNLDDEQMAQSKVSDFVCPAHLEKFEQQLRDLFAGNRSQLHMEVQFIGKDRQMRWGLLSAARVTRKQHKAVLHILDIQSEKDLLLDLQAKNIQLEKSNADLEQFAYVASHDLKSPLNAIKQLAGWIKEDAEQFLPEESKKHLSLLESRSQRMTGLLNDLLAYARIGKEEYHWEQFDIRPIVLDQFQFINPPPGFDVYCHSQPVHLPRIPFELVVRNLMSNAVKHHDKGAGKISVFCEEHSEHYTLMVEDDGPGILPEQHERVMRMFETLVSRDQVEGSGMGLAIVKKIIDHFHGTVSIESDGKRGTRFVINWPKRID